MIKGKVDWKNINFTCIGDFSSIDHFYVRHSLKFITGPLAGYDFPVIAYNGATKNVTLQTPISPNGDDEFIIQEPK